MDPALTQALEAGRGAGRLRHDPPAIGRGPRRGGDRAAVRLGDAVHDRCAGGISHNPAESITAADAQAAVRTLVEAIRTLAREHR